MENIKQQKLYELPPKIFLFFSIENIFERGLIVGRGQFLVYMTEFDTFRRLQPMLHQPDLGYNR